MATATPKLPARWRAKSYPVAPAKDGLDDHSQGHFKDLIDAHTGGLDIAFYPTPSPWDQSRWRVAFFVDGRYLRDFGAFSLLEAMQFAEQLSSYFPGSVVVGETVRSSTVSLNPMKGSDLDPQVPPQPWHVPGLIPAREVVLLSGDGGVNKSTVAQQLCTATALGRPWLGHQVLQGRSLFITSEDSIQTVNRRQLAIGNAEGVSLSELGDVDFVSLVGQDALLGMLDHESHTIQPTGLFDIIDRRVAETAPVLIVLDTLAGMFGGEENSRAHTRQFISLMYRMVKHHGSTVLLIGHPSLGGMASGSGLSGSTDWHNAVRGRLFLERVMEGPDRSGRMSEPDTCARILRTRKEQYGDMAAGMRLRFRDGVLVQDDQLPTASARITTAALEVTAEKVDAKFMELLAAYELEGRGLSASPSANYAPTVFGRDDRREGIGKAAFAKAMNRLFAGSAIKVEEYGPASRRQKKIVAC